MPNNGSFPNLYPFKLKLADPYGIPTQESNEELKQTMQRIYSEDVMMICSIIEIARLIAKRYGVEIELIRNGSG